MLENGPPCCPRPPHLPPPAPPVVAPQLPRCCRGWGQPRELLGIATPGSCPNSYHRVMECPELEGPTRVIESNSWPCTIPNNPTWHALCWLCWWEHQERRSERFAAPHPCPLAPQKGMYPEAPGHNWPRVLLLHPTSPRENTVRKAPDLLEPPAESTDMATGWSPSSICAPRTGISALGLSYFQSHAYAPGDFFYLGLVLQPTMSSWLE